MPNKTPPKSAAAKPATAKSKSNSDSRKTNSSDRGAPADPSSAAHIAQSDQPEPSRHSSSTAIQNVCVYCGSGHGTDPRYAQAAKTLGRDLARSGLGLVYGGGGLGLMGEVARATLKASGRVTGIIPEFLTQKEHMLREVSTLVVTKDMHERKRLMFEHSDAFVALPGGIGTLEELVEQLTWSQLGRHTKPIVVANIAGFWNPFLNLLAHMRDDQFIRNGINVRFIVVDNAEAIVPSILSAARMTTETVPDAAITAKF